MFTHLAEFLKGAVFLRPGQVHTVAEIAVITVLAVEPLRLRIRTKHKTREYTQLSGAAEAVLEEIMLD